MNKSNGNHPEALTGHDRKPRETNDTVVAWSPCEDAGTEQKPTTGGKKLERFLCPVDEAARIVGQKWTLQIVHHLLDGRARRFCELQEALGKVNPSTLSSRLKMLEEAGLVRRSQISNIPPHVEYTLTNMGEELRNVIVEITRWSNAHLCSGQVHQTEEAPLTALGRTASVAPRHSIKETA
jgi:DNA-binding HxlR family transcriptional regulator